MLIAEKKEELKSLHVELVDAHSNRFLLCGECDKKSQLKKCVVIDFEYYNENTGSPCGGYYEHGYYAWECPHCKCFRHNEIEKDEYYETYQAFKGEETKHEK
jgi:hypothetical protein